MLSPRVTFISFAALSSIVLLLTIRSDLMELNASRAAVKHHEKSFQVQIPQEPRIPNEVNQSHNMEEIERIGREASYRARIASRNALMANYSRPPLSSLLDQFDNITGDVQFLLDFAVIGFGKCGTSTVMHWLEGHGEVQAFDYEVWELMGKKPHTLIKKLYSELPAGPYKRGYKAPADITQAYILDYLRTLWPRSRLIVGIRHPVEWFQSLYNFRVQNMEPDQHMLHPNKLIGPCMRGHKNVCTDKANFAYNMIRLGKGNYPIARNATELELTIVSRRRTGRYSVLDVPYMPNPVFFFDLAQLADTNETRKGIFREDFREFMGLDEPLPPIPQFTPGRWWAEHIQKQKDSMKINVCDDQYKRVRADLMVLSRQNSQWIREVFLSSPTVHVSSRPFLEEILLSHMEDPCAPKTERKSWPW